METFAFKHLLAACFLCLSISVVHSDPCSFECSYKPPYSKRKALATSCDSMAKSLFIVWTFLEKYTQ